MGTVHRIRTMNALGRYVLRHRSQGCIDMGRSVTALSL